MNMKLFETKFVVILVLSMVLLTGLELSYAAPTPSPTTAAGFVYTANERGNSISVLDLRTGQVKTVTVSISPHNVQTSRDGRLLFAVGMAASGATGQVAMGNMEQMGTGKKTRGRLLILDTVRMNAQGRVNAQGAPSIEVGSEPAHVVVDWQGRRAYVTNSADNTVSVVDIVRRKVIATIATGAFPHGLRISPDGREIYVADVKANSVSVISVAAAKEVSRIPVGKGPVQVGFTPNGRRVYVSLRDENSIAVIDTARRKKIAVVPVGRNPIQLFVTPNGRTVYVANQGTEFNPGNTVSVVATATDHVVATLVTGRGAHGVVVSRDGRDAFITNSFADTVSVIDTATQKVLRNIKVGKGPNGITFSSAAR